jgi:DNA-repair protein complementing XP-A cells
MTDTKGGFLSAEDDPFNKALHSGLGRDGKEEKPAHMTLREWERHQLLKDLKRRKEGMYEPGLSVMGESTKKCRECGSLEIDWVWEEVFGCAVCHKCKEAKPEMYSLLTKTECRDDYLLTERMFPSFQPLCIISFLCRHARLESMLTRDWAAELKDEELLPHLNKPNPHKSHWHDMMLFLRYQVEAYAFGPKKWGSPEALDAEFERREAEKKKRKEQKFKTKLQELKKKTRTEHYRRQREGGGPAGFGEKIGGGRHEHEWGRTVENAEGVTVKKCTECGMEVEELEF